MQCRLDCGACCIAPSINTPLPGMPDGKPAGVACIHLSPDMRCVLFGDAHRPACCANFTPERAFCGDNREQALAILTQVESDTLLITDCGSAV